jgi:CheY-like chemotaxis protein
MLRQDKETRNIPIVFVTASVMVEGQVTKLSTSHAIGSCELNRQHPLSA